MNQLRKWKLEFEAGEQAGPAPKQKDLASLILFGCLLVLALGGSLSIDAKRRRKFGEQWTHFANVTSDIPFAAIASGRNRLGPALVEIGVWRPLAATLAYAVAFYLHGRSARHSRDEGV